MGFGKLPRLIHSLPCTGSPATLLPNQRLFIRQILSVDLFAKYIEQKFAHFSGVTSVSVCYFSLFLGITKQNFSIFLMHWRRWALRSSRAPGAGGGDPATPHFTPEKFQRHIPGLRVAGPFLRATRELALPPLWAPLRPPSRPRAERAHELPDRGGRVAGSAPGSCRGALGLFPSDC